MSESVQSATPSSSQQSPVKEDAPTITNALSKRFDPNFVASTFITGVVGADRHKFKGKWSWIYMACISSTFIVVCATLLWNSLFESCSLQNSSFDDFFTDSEIAGIVLKDGVRYCFSEFIKNDNDDYYYNDDDDYDDNNDDNDGDNNDDNDDDYDNDDDNDDNNDNNNDDNDDDKNDDNDDNNDDNNDDKWFRALHNLSSYLTRLTCQFQLTRFWT